MSTKHTHGPWQAHHDHGWLVVESNNGDMYIKVEKGSAAQKHMADALLIAAAPDLLQALQSMVDYYGTASANVEALESARAALAKAEIG